MNEEAQWAADAQAAPSAPETFAVAFLGAAFPGPGAAARPAAKTATLRKSTPGALPGPERWMHRHSPSRGAIRTRRGLCAWAQRRTLRFIVTSHGVVSRLGKPAALHPIGDEVWLCRMAGTLVPALLLT